MEPLVLSGNIIDYERLDVVLEEFLLRGTLRASSVTQSGGNSALAGVSKRRRRATFYLKEITGVISRVCRWVLEI